MQYDIEIFYEFGTDHYWDYVLKDLKSRDGAERRFSIHGPCVAVNLADPNDMAYLEVYEKTFAYAAKINAAFVVVHSNEAWHFAGEKLAVQELVCSRIEKLLQLAGKYGVTVALENVGCVQQARFCLNTRNILACLNASPMLLHCLIQGMRMLTAGN